MVSVCRNGACGNTLEEGDEFCRRCGASASGGARLGGLPISADWLNQDRMVAIGGAVALLGCFLPLMTGNDSAMSVLTIATKMNSWLWLEPLSAGILLWLGLIRRPGSPPQLEASVLALGSAWTSINLVAIIGLNAVISAFGFFARDAGIGIGLILCLVGFLVAAGAAFSTIRNYAISAR